MAKTKMDKNTIIKLVQATFLIVLGILFCFQQSISGVISLIIGIGLIVYGLLFVLNGFSITKSLLTPLSLAGYAIIGLGIYTIVADLVSTLLGYFPYLMIVIGSAAIIDAFVGYFAIKNKNVSLMVVKLVLGAILLTFAILILTNVITEQFMAIVSGICLALVGVYSIVTLFIKKSK